MADSIDEMKAELEAAGYYWFQDSQSGMTFFVSVCPPELSLSVELPDFDFPSREEWNKACEMERDILKNQLIEKAYAHLTEKRRVAELEAQNTAMKALLSSAALQLIELCLEDQERGNESSALRIHVKGVAAQMLGKLNELSE